MIRGWIVDAGVKRGMDLNPTKENNTGNKIEFVSNVNFFIEQSFNKVFFIMYEITVCMHVVEIEIYSDRNFSSFEKNSVKE